MAASLISQGVLNRALTSVSVIDLPILNVTSGYFGLKVARISFEGDASAYIATLTGATPSPNLYQMVNVTMYLNKSQSLAGDWEQQRLVSAAIGDVVVVTDSPVLPPYYFSNCILQNVSDLNLAGDDNDFPVMLRGTYAINGALFT